MSQNTKNIFAVSATDKSLQSKTSGVFGLNANANVSMFAYEEGMSKDDNPFKALKINYQVADREYMNTFFLNESVMVGNGDDRKTLNPGDEGYDDAFYTQYVQVVAVAKHTLGALGVTEDTINKALTGFDASQLLEGIKVLASLVPANFKTIPVDLFLEYQWNIGQDQEMTFLTAPKNMKGGEFVCAAMKPVGTWTEVRDEEEGLHYVDASGNKHLFTRNKAYMSEKKSYQQFKDGRHEKANSTQAPAQAAAKSNWD